MKKIVDYLPLLSICLMYFGFCNLYYYYKEFKIDIYNYISVPEIILSFFPTIVVITSLTYGYLYQTLISKNEKNTNEVKVPMPESTETKAENKKSFWKRPKSVGFWLAIVNIFFVTIQLFLLFILHIKSYNLKYYDAFCSFVFCLSIYIYILRTKENDFISKNALLVSICVVIYIGTQFQLLRNLDAQKIKDGLSDKKLTFKYGSKIITTSPTFLFIGQTQGNLFFYNRKDSSAIIFVADKIDSLSIK